MQMHWTQNHKIALGIRVGYFMGGTWILNAFCISGVAGCTKLIKLMMKQIWNNKEIIPTCFIVKYFNF